MRILGAVCASILATSLGTLAACGGAPESQEAKTSQAVSAASVSITLFDQNGTRVGEGSGVMIAPRLVLTSGHLISGKYKWVVTSADGKQKATGSRGMTYDWMKYDSNKAHPRKHDVGVIHLDESIQLSAYPKLVGEKSANGTKARRIRGTGAGFEQHDMTLAKYKSSPNAWLADGAPGETLDTGGAVYDARGILGIVSGRGTTTGKLYVARVDGLVKWLAPKVACAGGATGVRTYAPPSVDKTKEICEDAGAGTSSGNPGNPGGDTTSGGPGGSNPGDDNGGSCDGNNDGVCSGGKCGSGGTNGSSGPNGSTGPNNPGGDGTPGSSGAPGSNPGSSSGSDGSNPGGDGTPGSSGAPGNTGSSGGNTNTNTSSSGGNTGGAGGSQGTVPGSDNGGSDSPEACQGPNDNPEVCPPEPDGCVGPGCGGGQPDESIDYGNCACGSSGSDGIYLR